MTIPLHSRLFNNATVADWLGTAMTAATLAAKLLEELREGTHEHPNTALFDATRYLEQATEEVKTISAHVAHVAAYGERP